MTRISSSHRTISWTAALGLALVSLICFVATSRADRGAGSANNLVAAGRTISGNVVDSSGKPAANIAVKLLQKVSAIRGPAPRPPGGSPTGDSNVGTPTPTELQKGGGGAAINRNERIIKTMNTDAAGHFVFTDVPPGKYIILAGVGKVAVRQEEIDATTADPASLSLKLNQP